MVEKRKRDGKEKRQCQRLRRKEREEAEKNDDALIQAAIDENASRASGRADAQEAAEERLSPASAPSGQQIEGTSPSDRRYAAGLAMLRGSERFVKDPAAALRLFDGAARQGNVSAQHMSAIFYLHGIATDANRERAKELFEMAAQQCHPPSMYELGSLLLANEEEQARIDGLEWIRRASEQSYDRAIDDMQAFAQSLPSTQGPIHDYVRGVRESTQAILLAEVGWVAHVDDVDLLTQNHPQASSSCGKCTKAKGSKRGNLLSEVPKADRRCQCISSGATRTLNGDWKAFFRRKGVVDGA